jgi:spermidine/putrescine transport system substrate-binding protein
MDNWAIAAGAPNPEAAHAFINYVLTPEASLRELDYIGYHTGGAGIEDAARAADLEMLDLVFFNEEQIKTMHTQTLSSAQQRIVEIWDKTKASAGA